MHFSFRFTLVVATVNMLSVATIVRYVCFRATGRSILPQWGAADAEIKVPFGENTELKRSAFKAWSR